MIRIFRKLKHFYVYDLKIQRKLIISHFLLLLIPMVIVSLLFYNRLFNIIQDNVMSSELHAMQQTSSYVEYVVNRLYNSSNIILEDNNLKMLFHSGEPEALDSDAAEAARGAASFLQSALNQVDGNVVTGIAIYVDEAHSYLCNDPAFQEYGVFQPISTIVSAKWYDIMQAPAQAGDETVWLDYLVCPKDYLTSEEKNTRGTFSVVRPIFSGSRSTPAAYLSLYFSKDNIEDSLSQAVNTSDSVAYLINQDNYLVAASDYSLANSAFIKYSAIDELMPFRGSWTAVRFGSDEAYVSYNLIDGSDWRLISVLRAEAIGIKRKEMLLLFLAVYLLVAGFTYIVAIILANSLTNRIQLLEQQLITVESGRPLPLDFDGGRDEVGSLIDGYNSMANRLNALVEETLRIAGELRASELKALQAQINPHFLYNTLDMINWLSKKGEDEAVSTAIHNLSKFYKLTLSSGNVIVSIADEIQHMQLYVSLQNMRYNNRIHLIVDIPEEILEYKIPKIILQPIVENAIQHGIICKPGKEGVIVVNAWAEGDTLVLVVSDDGVGMDQNTLEQIISGTYTSKDGSSIGIMNTHKRLQLFFGDERFGLTCKSSPDKGTDVEIRIPVQKSLS